MICAKWPSLFLNSSPPGQNGRHFSDNIFKCIFMREKSCMSIRILLKFVSKSPIDNISALVPVMAWRQTGDKPLPEPMLTQFTDAYMNSDEKNLFIIKINGTSTAWKKLTRFDTHHCNSYWKISLYIEILYFINGLVQDWSMSIANALEIQCTLDISQLVGSKQWYRDISESTIYPTTDMSQNQAPFTSALGAIMGLFHV